MSWISSADIRLGKIRIPGMYNFIIALAIIAYATFQGIDRVAVEIWDESLFALRALYMYEVGEYMPNFDQFENLPNHRNTKLPFTSFLQVASYHLFGVGNWQLRLPIGLIFLATIIMASRFAYRNGFSPIIALIAGILLTTSTGFLGKHMLRTGDQDAPFACYLLLAILYFYEYLNKKNNFSIVLFTGFTIAAFLTKNLLAGLILPGMLVYIIFSGKLTELLVDRRIYYSLFAIIAAYVGTVGYLEMQYPGFIDRMWNYELMGRYSETIEGHSGGIFFYVDKLFNEHFKPMAFLALPALLWIWIKGSDKSRSLALYLVCSIVGYLAIISFSGTKTTWYHAPVFPMIAFLIALGIVDFWQNAQHWAYKPFVVTAGILVATSISYNQAVGLENQRHPAYGVEGYNTFLPVIEQSHEISDSVVLFDNQFGTDTYFYSRVFNRRSNRAQYFFEREAEHLKLGQQILVCKGFAEKEIRDNFEVKVIAKSHNCSVLELISAK